jgi:hypothetical protein
VKGPFLFALGLVLALGSVSGAFVFLSDGRDEADRSRVVDVRPSPDGLKAAVLYVYLHAESSGTTVRVALSEPPFPAIGADLTSKRTIAVVRGGGSDAMAKAAVDTAWQPNGKLSVCAAPGSLISFSADGEAGDHAGIFEESEVASLCFCDVRPLANGVTPVTPP